MPDANEGNLPYEFFADCPAGGVFSYQRIKRPQDLPVVDERIIDVAVLDMNHGWANLGHDSLVHLVQDVACEVTETLQTARLSYRVLSFDVRNAGMVPEGPGGRFKLYLGTGGPGHIDPHRNDGKTDGSQGIRENPQWERPVFDLLDAVAANSHTALLGVCHTFGVMCRWSAVAMPALRGPEKGGKSSGILENLLTAEAHQHPWFRHFANRLPEERRLRIIDNRLFDLIPQGPLPAGLIAIGYETLGLGGPPGDSLTMAEWDRDCGGVIPRMFAVNHHPEIRDRERQLTILQSKRERGEVSQAWVKERLDILTRNYPDENSEQRLRLTSDFTLVAPLRFYLFRETRLRAHALGKPVPLNEDQVLREYTS